MEFVNEDQQLDLLNRELQSLDEYEDGRKLLLLQKVQ